MDSNFKVVDSTSKKMDSTLEMMDMTSEVMNPFSCCHVDKFKAKGGVAVYKHIHTYYISCLINGSREAKVSTH